METNVHSNLRVDVLIIIALKEELNSSDFFSDLSWTDIDNNKELSLSTAELGVDEEKIVTIAKLLMNDQGPESASILTTQCLHIIHPNLLVSVGISGRISSDLKIGDVVLASLSDNTLYRAKMKDGRPDLGGREWSVDALSKPLFQELEKSPPFYSFDPLTEKEKEELYATELIGIDPETIYGPIASSTLVVDDEDWVSWIKKCRNRHVLAVDMESSSIIQAAHMNGIRDGRVLVVRGISDPADGQKKKIDLIGKGKLRKIAMNNATQLIRHTISKIISFNDGEIRIKKREFSKENSAFHKALKSLEYFDDEYSDELENEYNDVLIKINDDPATARQIKELSNSSYQFKIRKNQDRNFDSIRNLNSKSLNFLIAYKVMDSIKGNADEIERLNILSNVYPYQINQFCKYILNENNSEKIYIDSLVKAYEEKVTLNRKNKQLKERARSHISYLLGRVSLPQLKIKAIEELVCWRNKLENKKTKNNNSQDLLVAFSNSVSSERRLLIRTISISLIILEYEGEAERYVKSCLKDNGFDSLNRGFHLEYYGDIDYDPSELMQSSDPIKIPIKKTYTKLLKNLTDSYAKNKHYPLRDIELQTLLSLVQKRLENGVLDDFTRESTLNLLDSYTDSHLTEIKSLQQYLNMVREHLRDGNFRCSDILVKLFELKKMKRSGWNDSNDEKVRINPNPESVLSHTSGGLILIEFLLPERLSDGDIQQIGKETAKNYDKSRILKMFLVHDLAEAFTGDLTPNQKNDYQREQEKEVVSRLNLLPTYGFFENTSLLDLWEDFENELTINGKIAHEIDRLDNLLQLEIENSNEDVTISDYIKWKSWILDRVHTPVGRRIANFIVGEL